MTNRVGIVEVAMTPGAETKDYFLDQVFKISKEVLDKSGISRDDVGTVISASSDVFHGGMSCANSYYWDAGAAFLKNGSRQDGESLFAFIYAVMRILSGHYDTALVLAVCKGSENPENDMLTHFFTDPFYQRQMGLNETIAAALQKREYMDRYGITEEQCAGVVVKNLKNALGNPYAHVKKKVDLDDVLASEVVMDPLKRMECAPKSEGIIAMVLAKEELAKKLTDKPVWFKGYGSSIDGFYLGDRDLLEGELPNAAKRAYDVAGIKDPRKEIDVAEVCEPYAFQEMLWCEDLGFCGRGEGGKLLESGATAANGDIPVNPSGGVLAMNPYVSRGLYRLAEGFLQIRGQAGERQLDKRVNTALAHSTHGFAGQCHAVAIIGS
ncbi:MAG: thiolase family protein [Deltaproteobacteria bacterium]|nr:thiolase family protein [Deltaproteobacteria bacterium]